MKACPFCGTEGPEIDGDWVFCKFCGGEARIDCWEKRPEEDRLEVLLHVAHKNVSHLAEHVREDKEIILQMTAKLNKAMSLIEDLKEMLKPYQEE